MRSDSLRYIGPIPTVQNPQLSREAARFNWQMNRVRLAVMVRALKPRKIMHRPIKKCRKD